MARSAERPRRAAGRRTRGAPTLHRALGACLLALCLSFVFAGATVQPRLSHVDGISDQNLARWGDGPLSVSAFSRSYFANFFRTVWVRGNSALHIQFARFVIPWDIMGDASGERLHYELFAAWLEDVKWLGLTPDVAIEQAEAPIVADGRELRRVPSSSAMYREYVAALLSYASSVGEPIRYLEAWNEPNNSGTSRMNEGHPPAAQAAEFMNAATALCAEHGCTPIAGDFLDSQYARAGHEEVKERATGMGVNYEDEYVAHLRWPYPVNWGFHPYAAVKFRTTETISSFEQKLPTRDVSVWLTEVGVYLCQDGRTYTPREQQEGARYLNSLINSPLEVAHVFYYELKAPSEDQEAKCPGLGGADTSVYDYKDEARPAAEVIFGGSIPAQGGTG